MALTSIQLIDYAGMGFLAASGAIAAAERREDAVTFIFFGTFTGVGGGTLRDLLIGAPVFWIAKPAYLLVCLAAAAAVWVFGWGKGRELALNWLDAVGMAAYAIVGALKALSLGVPPLSAVIMGV